MSSAVQKCLKELLAQKTASVDAVRGALQDVMRGKATEGQIGAFLSALQFVGYGAEIVSVCGDVLLEHAESMPLELREMPDGAEFRGYCDIVGTGGDGIDTFNVSTAAGLVCAGAGLSVAKHGNRSASSQCGSADILEALGVNLQLSGAECAEVVRECGYCFLFAQRMHPAMRHVGPVRRQLGVRTVFNVLGPLINPARPRFMVTGVCNREIGAVYADIFRARTKSGVMERGMVVCSHEGMDEISPAGPTHIWMVEGGEVTERDVSPADFGIPEHPLEAVRGGGPDANARMMFDLVDGRRSAVRDFVVLNAAALLVVAGVSPSFLEGAKLAERSLDSGAARRVLERYIYVSHAQCLTPGQSIVHQIVTEKRRQLAVHERLLPLEELSALRPAQWAVKALPENLGDVSARPFLLFAEVKRASPSKGRIATEADAPSVALEYAAGGAAVVSVLTEARSFHGTLADLAAVRRAFAKLDETARPLVLRKDFVFSRYQVAEAYAYGADLVLLIVAVLQGGEQQLRDLLAFSRELGMEALVEVNDEAEVRTACAAGARLIGINNRNLNTFSVDMETTSRLMRTIGPNVPVIALSGVRSRSDAETFRAAGVRGILVGEALMRSSDRTAMARSLLLNA